MIFFFCRTFFSETEDTKSVLCLACPLCFDSFAGMGAVVIFSLPAGGPIIWASTDETVNVNV